MQIVDISKVVARCHARVAGGLMRDPLGWPRTNIRVTSRHLAGGAPWPGSVSPLCLRWLTHQDQ